MNTGTDHGTRATDGGPGVLKRFGGRPCGDNFVDLSRFRREYSHSPWAIEDLHPDPMKQFEDWFQEACGAGIPDPNAMVLATIGQGAPTQRTVLLKYYDHQGIVFFTNYASRKARHIDQNADVCLLFPWYLLQRQVEINGRAIKISAAQSVKYFLARPRGAQLGAWASPQSSVIKTTHLLEAKFEELKRRFSGRPVPCPSFWGGYRVIPNRFEFWQGCPNRMHDRYQYTRQDERWMIEQLAP